MITRIVKTAALALAFILAAGMSAYLTVTLIIKAEDTVIVPDLVGKDVVYALESLTDLELNTKVKGSEYSWDIPKNHVIYQHPESGSEIKKGRDIRIIISKGPQTVSLPNLMTLSAQQARLILEENDVCQGETSRTYNDSVEKDHIIAQFPSPGFMITRGACVDLLISLGSPPKAYKMPDLKGLFLEEAMLSIEKVNLSIAEIKSSDNRNQPRNIIVDQEPPPGFRVIAGNTVNLIINRKTKDKGHAELYGHKFGRLFRYRIQNGFLRRKIRVSLNSAGITNDIFDGFVKPGEEIWLLIPSDGDTTVFLYENDKLVKTETFDAG